MKDSRIIGYSGRICSNRCDVVGGIASSFVKCPSIFCTYRLHQIALKIDSDSYLKHSNKLLLRFSRILIVVPKTIRADLRQSADMTKHGPANASSRRRRDQENNVIEDGTDINITASVRYRTLIIGAYDVAIMTQKDFALARRR